MPQPLPLELPESLNHLDAVSEIRSAYSRILMLEQAVHSDPNPRNREQKLVHARVLGYLIREGPSMHASECVAKEVNSCQNNDEMDKIGETYYLHYIRSFRKQHNDGTLSRFSSPSHPWSRISFETKKEMTVHPMLGQGGRPLQGHGQAKKNALVRDDFRCIVSGRYDCRSVQKNHEIKKQVLQSRSPPCMTQCTYILFPHWNNSNPNICDSDGDGNKQHDAHVASESGWATIMKRFGYEDLPDKLNGGGIHSLDNVITLEPSIRVYFDQLELWFEAMEDKENTYTIHAIDETHLYGCKANPITLESAHLGLLLPNPDYLWIHAACCRVAHLSGASEYMDMMFEDLEDSQVLSEDGSSAHVFSFTLQPYSQEVISF